MTITYQQALAYVQAGYGTDIQSVDDQPTRIVLRIPKQDAPLIYLPLPDAPITGIVPPEFLSNRVMEGRRGAVTGKGIVFRNLAENDGQGIWQSAPTDGTAAFIFNAATPQQYDMMQTWVADAARDERGEITLSALDKILTAATQSGLTDRYNTTLANVEDGYVDVRLSVDQPLAFPHKKPVQTTAVFVPADTGLDWNPNGPVIEHFRESVLIISKRNEHGQPTDLRHLNPDDAERKYRLLNGDAVSAKDAYHTNLAVLTEQYNMASPRHITGRQPMP